MGMGHPSPGELVQGQASSQTLVHPRDVIMSSICWHPPPSWGFCLPAALHSNANALPTTPCSVGKGFAARSSGRHPHVHAVLRGRGWKPRGPAATSPGSPFHLHPSCSHSRALEHPPRARPMANSSACSSQRCSSVPLRFFPPVPLPESKLFSEGQSQLRLPLPQGGREVLAMQALSSLAATGVGN